MQTYSEYRRPDRLERHVPEYFNDWLKGAQEAARKKGSNEEATSFAGFGKSGANDEAAWSQWFYHVLWVNNGCPEEDEDG